MQRDFMIEINRRRQESAHRERYGPEPPHFVDRKNSIIFGKGRTRETGPVSVADALFYCSRLDLSFRPRRSPRTTPRWAVVAGDDKWRDVPTPRSCPPHWQGLWWSQSPTVTTPTLWHPGGQTRTVLLCKAGANILCSGHAFYPTTTPRAGGYAGKYVG